KRADRLAAVQLRSHKKLMADSSKIEPTLDMSYSPKVLLDMQISTSVPTGPPKSSPAPPPKIWSATGRKMRYPTCFCCSSISFCRLKVKSQYEGSRDLSVTVSARYRVMTESSVSGS